jgi:hypothetical protein
MGWNHSPGSVPIDSLDDPLDRFASFVDLILHSAHATDILWIIWLLCVTRWGFSDFLPICDGKSHVCLPVPPGPLWICFRYQLRLFELYSCGFFFAYRDKYILTSSIGSKCRPTMINVAGIQEKAVGIPNKLPTFQEDYRCF